MKFNSNKFLVIRQTVLTMMKPIQILEVAEADKDCSLILFKVSQQMSRNSGITIMLRV